MIVKLKKLNDSAVLPKKVHNDDFCYDVTATSIEEIRPNVFKYGIGWAAQIGRNNEQIGNVGYMRDNKISLPYIDFEKSPILISIDARPRSSINKTGLILANSIGTIDEQYTGEIFIVFYKVLDGEIYKVGDRIAQIKLGFTLPMNFIQVDELSQTVRGDGGFGHTGK